MLNKEKFKDEIVEIACKGYDFALKDGTVVKCQDTDCWTCSFSSHIDGVCCTVNRKNWANSEYEEYVDWSKVPVDTKILVRDAEDQQWKRRYFAGKIGVTVTHGGVYTFACGRTSFTSDGRKCYWKYAKLYKEEEECTK